MANNAKKTLDPRKVANRRNARLSDFIRENTDQIVSEWTAFAKTLTPASTSMTPMALRDHVMAILAFIADDLESYQTSREQIEKSHGDGPKEGGVKKSAAEIHASLRLADGFDIDQMVSEYRALRASVVKLWTAKNPDLSGTDFRDLNRFNEAIDQALTESISHFTKKIDQSRNMFLGILGHDLRNPIGAASMSAQLMATIGSMDAKHSDLTSQIIRSTARAGHILTDLLDLTRAGFGSDLPVTKAPVDMGVLGKELVDEMRSFYPRREIGLEISGDMKGEWDSIRIGQVFSNLIGNAIQYSFKDTPISVGLTGHPDDVVLAVHNEGVPIPPDKIGKIFDSLTRVVREESESHPASANLGLGLYITKKIVEAHDGTISVSSSEKDGTTFTVAFPRTDKARHTQKGRPDVPQT